MRAVAFSRLAGTIFAVIALAHAYRLVSFFPIQIGSLALSQTASWLGVAVAGLLAYLGLRARA